MKKFSQHILIMLIVAAVVALFQVAIEVNAQRQSCPPGEYEDPNEPGECRKIPGSLSTSDPNLKSKIEGEYILLEPIRTNFGTLDKFLPQQKNALGVYLNLMIQVFIGLCAVLAVVMIVIGGIEYMTSELISSKQAGKEKITSAIFGLVLALGAYTILYTINPNLLNTDIKIKDERVALRIEVLDVVATMINADGSTTIINNVDYSKNYTGENALNECIKVIDPNCKMITGYETKNGKYVEKIFAENLEKLRKELIKNENNLALKITEAIPSGPGHRDTCHNNGRCVDIDFTGNTQNTPNNINKFITLAQYLNMCPIWESNNKNDLNGVKLSRYVAYASGPHFHLSNGSCR